MGRRNRARPPARPKPFLDPKPVILVVTEGQNTEPEYLEQFKVAVRNARVELDVHGGRGVPVSIVEYAKLLKKAAEERSRKEEDDNLRYDAVWCVFDVDQHPRIEDAIESARHAGIEIALSNPCIELWLLLHFQDQPGAQDRHSARRLLKKHIPDYNKHIEFRLFRSGYEVAVRRAKRLDEEADADNERGRNPSSGFWRLTEAIRTGA